MTSSSGYIFRVTGLLCGEFTGHRWFPCTKAGDAELRCFLWSATEPTVKKTTETPVIWDAITPIMTSLWCPVARFVYFYSRPDRMQIDYCDLAYIQTGSVEDRNTVDFSDGVSGWRNPFLILAPIMPVWSYIHLDFSGFDMSLALAFSSYIFNGLCVFSLPMFFVVIMIIFLLHLIIIINSEIWISSHWFWGEVIKQCYAVYVLLCFSTSLCFVYICTSPIYNSIIWQISDTLSIKSFCLVLV